MPVYRWSQTAATNGTADPACQFPEGMSPAALNDGNRGMMAEVAKYRDDIAGAIVTGGISTAYTISSYSSYTSLTVLDGQMIAFTPHATNGQTVTLNVDGLGAKPLRTAPNVELQSNVLIQGTPYVCTFSNSDGVFYLHNLASNTYGIPLGAGMDYWLATTPSSAFAFLYGQAISRTTYATLFAAMGTTYGAGDGSTTFRLPDKRGRVSAGKGDMGGGDANLLNVNYFGADGKVLGATGGSQTHILSASEIPSHTHSGTTGAMNSNASHSHSVSGGIIGGTSISNLTASGFTAPLGGASIVIDATNTDHTHGFTTNGGTGGGAAHAIVQPTIVANYIMRII